ncbi:MAG TPA: GNAT family N-acetyltransferase [Gemmatimonadaceae bacterium]|nr:GNAT family N-acetyltransferase [Gemmatimonadaceae bacterium]
MTSREELSACVALQEEIWGEGFSGVVPASLLKVTTHVGGILAGAFDAGGRLVGFVFGITGVEQGEIVHWSHMLGVSPAARDQGIGRKLKEYQRAELQRIGVARIYWTFDPLVARNAHFNFNVLGVHAREYVVDMYGEGTSPLHRGIGTDRLIVSWTMKGSTSPALHREPVDPAFSTVRIQVPGDIAALQRDDMAAARQWRARTRDAFTAALAKGLTIASFELDVAARGGSYVLAPSSSKPGPALRAKTSPTV